MDEALKIFTLGGLSIQNGDTPVAGFVSRKVDALLVYLACNRREQPREALAELLWDDLAQARSMANLRMVLSSLQRQLAPFVLVTRQTVGINPGSTVWLDVAELEGAIAAAEAQWDEPAGISRSTSERLDEALALYHGDFLAGFHIRDSRGFEDWMIIEQERLRDRVIVTLERLIDYALARGSYTTGIAQARRLLQLDPLWEAGHRQLMLLFARSGQRNAALAQYETCRQVLRNELDVEPDEETTNLYEQIQAGRVKVDQELPAVPRNLPLPATPFIGRVAELAQIAEQIDQPGCRLLTLIGPGGIGKTRVALQAASERVKDFRNGVCIVTLPSVSGPGILAAAIANALKFTFPGTGDLTDQLIDHLSNKNILLIIDNFEHVLDGVELLSDLLANAPAVKIITTSRERLNLQEEWILPIAGMDIPADAAPATIESSSAVQLFLQSARRVQTGFVVNGNLPAVIRICQLVEGLPLGIELAAAWVRMMPCEQIADQIERDLDFLATPLRNIPERHRSIRVLFEQSWQRLQASERAALMNLSVFRGGFDLSGAAKVGGASLPVLSSLVERSLVRSDLSGRYDMHELLRRSAYDKLLESGEGDSTQAAHCEYFMAWAEALDRHEDASEVRFEQFDAEYDNLRAALTYALEHQQAEWLLRLSSALTSYWKLRGLSKEGRQWLEQGILLGGTGGTSREVRAHAISNAGILAWNQSDFGPARQLLEESLTLFRTFDDEAGMSKALNQLGYVALNTGDHPAAKAAFEEVLTHAREQRNRLTEATALGSLGLVASELVEYDLARRYIEEGLAIFRELEQKERISVMLNNLGTVFLKQENYEQAQAYYEESLLLARQLGHKPNTAFLVANLGEVALKRGDLTRARSLYGESLLQLHEIGDRLSATILLESLAGLAVAERRGDRAAQLFGAAATMRETLGAPIMPRERAEYNQSLNAARRALGTAKFADEWDVGSVMSLDQAIAYALEAE